ncbi:MAG: phosphoglycerate mutase family protein [Bdellovibrionota bacterium]|nr:phosphoglycerate mutase family protein [Bdellovibrionota bacterium]
MKLFFMRHSESISPSQYNGPDNLRPLSKQGQQVLKGIAPKVVKRLQSVDYLISSPYMRARQSLEILKPHFKKLPESIEIDLLEPDYSDHKHLLSYLISLEVDEVLMLGHEPQIRGFIQYLIGTEDSLRLHISLASLHLVEIPPNTEFTPGFGVLSFSVPPEIW